MSFVATFVNPISSIQNMTGSKYAMRELLVILQFTSFMSVWDCLRFDVVIRAILSRHVLQWNQYVSVGSDEDVVTAARAPPHSPVAPARASGRGLECKLFALFSSLSTDARNSGAIFSWSGIRRLYWELRYLFSPLEIYARFCLFCAGFIGIQSR